MDDGELTLYIELICKGPNYWNDDPLSGLKSLCAIILNLIKLILVPVINNLILYGEGEITFDEMEEKVKEGI